MSRDRDELSDFNEEEMSDAEAREALIIEITALYEENARNPTFVGIELETALRAYLTIADSLADARDEAEEEARYMELDDLGPIIDRLRDEFEKQMSVGQLRAMPPEPGAFIITGNDTIQ